MLMDEWVFGMDMRNLEGITGRPAGDYGAGTLINTASNRLYYGRTMSYNYQFYAAYGDNRITEVIIKIIPEGTITGKSEKIGFISQVILGVENRLNGMPGTPPLIWQELNSDTVYIGKSLPVTSEGLEIKAGFGPQKIEVTYTGTLITIKWTEVGNQSARR